MCMYVLCLLLVCIYYVGVVGCLLSWCWYSWVGISAMCMCHVRMFGYVYKCVLSGYANVCVISSVDVRC